MKHLLSAIFLLFSCSVFGQADTIFGEWDAQSNFNISPKYLSAGLRHPVLRWEHPNLQLPTEKPKKQGYRITKTKLIGWTVLGFTGFMDGAVEGYEFDDRKFFELKYGADPYGFWGSQSWRKIYVNGDPAQGCKTVLGCSLGSFDFYHVSDDLRKLGYIAGGMTIALGAKDQKVMHTLLDFAIGFGVSAVTKNLGMSYIRSWR